MTLKPHPRENLWFGLRVAFSLLTLWFLVAGAQTLLNPDQDLWATLAAAYVGVIVVYALLIWAYFWTLHLVMVGHVRGNGVRVTADQFPELFAFLTEASAQLGLKKAPQVYLVQEGGLLNAWATRFVGRDYIALYSELFAVGLGDPEVLKFILGHELTHVRRRHLQKRFWTFLSAWVPFLGAAYSRACEHTCDAGAQALAPAGARNALVLLAAGRDLYPRIQVEAYLAAARADRTAAVRFAGVLGSHPHLPLRIAYLEARSRA